MNSFNYLTFVISLQFVCSLGKPSMTQKGHEFYQLCIAYSKFYNSLHRTHEVCLGLELRVKSAGVDTEHPPRRCRWVLPRLLMPRVANCCYFIWSRSYARWEKRHGTETTWSRSAVRIAHPKFNNVSPRTHEVCIVIGLLGTSAVFLDAVIPLSSVKSYDA